MENAKKMPSLKQTYNNLTIKQQKVLLVSIIIIFMSLLFVLLAVLTDGAHINGYMCHNPVDTFMDYFNMLALLRNGDPYVNYSNYPPLVFAILQVLFGLIPSEFHDLGPFELKQNAFAVVTFIIFLIINLFIIIAVVSSFLKDCGKIKYLFIFALLCSGPFIFTIERGNVILIAIAFTLLFYRLYNSDKFIWRLLSYVALAIAISIKIYPAVFGLLVLSKKRFKEFALLVGISVVLFFVPFFFFGGINDISRMIAGITSSSSSQSSIGSNFNFSFVNYFSMIEELFHCSIQINNLIFQLLSSLLVLSAYFLSKKEHIRLLSLTFVIIYFPAFSYTYSLLFFIIPLIAFFNDERSMSEAKYQNIYFVIFYSLLLSPIYLPIINQTDLYFDLSYSYLLLNILVISALVVMLFLSIKEFLLSHKNKNTEVVN